MFDFGRHIWAGHLKEVLSFVPNRFPGKRRSFFWGCVWFELGKLQTTPDSLGSLCLAIVWGKRTGLYRFSPLTHQVWGEEQLEVERRPEPWNSGGVGAAAGLLPTPLVKMENRQGGGGGFGFSKKGDPKKSGPGGWRSLRCGGRAANADLGAAGGTRLFCWKLHGFLVGLKGIPLEQCCLVLGREPLWRTTLSFILRPTVVLLAENLWGDFAVHVLCSGQACQISLIHRDPGTCICSVFLFPHDTQT